MYLVEGNTGTQVKYLQQGLRILCYNPKRLDGVFDVNTTSAVKNYQAARGLTPDGIVGDGTWGNIKSDITPIQTALKSKGFYTGTIDGVAGDGTYNALIEFQAANGLTPDGMAGSSTLSKLYAADPTQSKPVLKLGSTGEYVIELQQKLIILGYPCGDGGADGIFGDDTYRAVRMFQQNNGLSIDGIVGSNTWVELETALPNDQIENPLLVLGSSGSAVMRLQNRLIELEYDCGALGSDGFFGSATQAAVINFQKNNGLNVDGKVGPNTWEKLNSTNPVKGSGTNSDVLREGNSGDVVRILQERLIFLGYSCGSTGADGIYGRNTTLAVIKFQKINGLSPDGIAGSITLTCLYSESAKANDGSADIPTYPSIPATGSLLEYTIGVISAQEGNYNSINPTDILSIGLLQWRASRAYNLLVDIRNRNEKSFDAIMSGTTIGNYIIAGNSTPFESITPTSLSSSELTLLGQLLDTEESHQAQEDLKRNDVNSYIEYGKSLGITDGKVLIYFSDCYNQSPKGISRIGNQINGQWSTLSLEGLHNYALQDIYVQDGIEYGLGVYQLRRNSVYEKASSYNALIGSTLSEYVENMVIYAIYEATQDRFEGLPDSDRGKENYNKYNAWFPSAQGNAWCACFISWCANKAGLLNVSGQLGLVPKSVSVAQYLLFYQEQNRFGDKATYTPKRGDIFINKSNGASHVGIVTGYDHNSKTFTTIEGNTADDTVQEQIRSITASGLTGFGINTP
jgi:peptidoglycan hydrolase-like protein with peptidoglycan-binding domain